MTRLSDTDLAEKLTPWRAWMAIAIGGLFVISQIASLGDPPLGRSAVIHFAAWIAWAIVLAIFLLWSIGLPGSRTLFGLMNDENTVDHRRRALATGLWCALAAAFAVYAATFYETFSARDACRLIVTAAIAPALVRFGWLELKALYRG